MKNLFSIDEGGLSFNPEPVSLEQYNQAFCQRTEQLRLTSGHTDITLFAQLLGMTAKQYLIHEASTPLPHSLILLFCSLVGANITEIYGEPND